MIFAPTAHYFMQLLNGVLDYDPAGVLRMATAVAVSSARVGYNMDPLAIEEVVRLVESILANHRDRVQAGEPLENLLDLLDVFADAGWPAALRLAWGLDQIYR